MGKTIFAHYAHHIQNVFLNTTIWFVWRDTLSITLKKRPYNNIFPLKNVAKKFFHGILFKIVKILNNFLLDSSAYSASFAWSGGGIAIAVRVEDSYFFPLTYPVIWFTLKFFKKKCVFEILVFVSCYSELQKSFKDCTGVSIKIFVKKLFLKFKKGFSQRTVLSKA